ncbi:HAD-IA family hydrolase [Streptomyces sp. RB6PN25]|uniref:HAD-IA family hydrolase n=1 Tax=Streptomyces humicola TaxID=2953240 RepID=A0ABT1Q0C8_9ACTN|nr:HAD-IA family hydrolase [Streptomyces humicola]MCQ4083334.1 HAD-IA family hydrolase [Streptomyces humicola]
MTTAAPGHFKGCIFDFSGTLFRVEPAGRWLRAALAEAGISASEDEIARYADRLDRAGALPGSRSPEFIPPHLERLWELRDVDATRHRAAYVGLAHRAELPWPELYDVLYERHMSPAAWDPYPDTVEVLATLHERGAGVAVLSNIGWDLRPVLRAHGVDSFVDSVVLSFEHHIQKPDPRIFRLACDRLGQSPENLLMVGDDRRADGAATELGCAFHAVDHLPVDERPDALRPVLELVG